MSAWWMFSTKNSLGEQFVRRPPRAPQLLEPEEALLEGRVERDALTVFDLGKGAASIVQIRRKRPDVVLVHLDLGAVPQLLDHLDQ